MTFADLYPELSPDELKEAERNFRQYLEVAYEVATEAAQKQAIENHETRGKGPDETAQ